MLIGVIEDKGLTFLPDDVAVDHLHPATLGLSGNLEPEVGDDDATGEAAVAPDMHAWLKDREHRGHEAWDLGEGAHRLGAARDILIERKAVADQEEAAPSAALRNLTVIGAKLVHGRHRRYVAKNLLRLAADSGRRGLQLTEPGKETLIENWIKRDARKAREQAIERIPRYLAKLDDQRPLDGGIGQRRWSNYGLFRSQAN